MKYLSLYRKYRPAVFEDIVEQDYIVKILRNQVINKSIAHAYLFTGTRGTGKTTIARIFARAINCENPINGSPCLQCACCKALGEVNGDIYELDAASNNGVDNIRDIRDSVQYQPLFAKYKVYIIDEVHQLSTQAFNAFLKTLEEPPEYCVFILATTEPQKLPQTILSRCLKLDFRLLSNEGLCNHITQILNKEGVEYTPEAVNKIAESGEGSVRDTLSVLEACVSAGGNKIDYNTVLEVLGSNNPEFIANLVDAIIGGDLNFSLSQIQYATYHGKNIPVLSRDILKFLRDLLIIKTNKDAKSFLNLPSNIFESSKNIADKYGANEILKCLDVFTAIDSSLRYSTTPRYVLETAIAKCSSLSDCSMLDTKQRLEAVERKIEKGVVVTKVVREVAMVNGAVATNASENDNIISNAKETTVLPFETALSTPVENVELPFDVTENNANGEEIKIDKPNQKAVNRAKAQRLRTELCKYFEDNKLIMLYTIISDKDNYIFVNNNLIEIVLRAKLDLNLIQEKKDVIKKIADEVLSGDYNIAIKFSETKVTEESFIDQFNVNKIIVKK